MNTPSDNREFNVLLLSAVDKALAESVGEAVGGALKAFIPVGVVATDPKGFATKLERLTGGNKLVEQKIMKHLEELISQRSTKPVDPVMLSRLDFGQFVETCRGQFNLN